MEQIEKEYVGFSVELVKGSKAKKLLSNHLAIQMEDSRSTSRIVLTSRQARALRKFLDDNLDD